MAKKKGKNGGSSNGGADEADQQTRLEDQQQEAAGDEAAAAAEQQPPAGGNAGIEDLSLEQLRAELSAAQAEIQALKAELAVLSDRDVVKASKPHDVQELQDKLARLRKEQQAADAARDKAWQQLKTVVEEISNLANPDYLQSVQVRPHD